MDPVAQIALLPNLAHATGGPASFQRRLRDGLENRGMSVSDASGPGLPDAVLVTIGTRRLWKLRQLKGAGVRIVQRLGLPPAWHPGYELGPVARARQAARQVIVQYIRSHLADVVVYQSRYAQREWESHCGPTCCRTEVIHNGVDLALYSPAPESGPIGDELVILSVEGAYGRPQAALTLAFVEAMAAAGVPVRLRMAGHLTAASARLLRDSALLADVVGWEPAERMPAVYRSGHIFFSADIGAACPNSVIEALACGVPVVGFAAGALSELVAGDAGVLIAAAPKQKRAGVPANVGELAVAVRDSLPRLESMAAAARELAVARHSVDRMVDSYVRLLLG